MGFSNKQIESNTDLTNLEVKFLLQVLAQTAFKGEMIKIVYTIITKLEKQLEK